MGGSPQGLGFLSPCWQNRHRRALKTWQGKGIKSGEKKEKNRETQEEAAVPGSDAQGWVWDMAPRWIRVLLDRDTEGRRMWEPWDVVWVKKGRKLHYLHFFLFFHFSAPLTKLSARQSQILMRKKLGSVGGLLAALRAFPGQPSWKYGIS